MKYTKEEIAESKASLLTAFKNTKSEVWATVNSVAKSGMSRRISLFVIETRKGQNPELLNLTYHAARVLDNPENDTGMRVDGCGMDMLFNTIYRLENILKLPRRYSNSYRRI